MKLTEIGKDYIMINDSNYGDIKKPNAKIHLIKLAFSNPTEEKIDTVVETFYSTNRYVISNNIKDYNSIFKKYQKKYYVENTDVNGKNLISFLRKNNKILFNFVILNDAISNFIIRTCFFDILKNVEVIIITDETFKYFEKHLSTWSGNVIIATKQNLI